MSVVVITHNRAPELARTLVRLEVLPERPAVVVVDNGSTDDTVAMVRRDHPGVIVLEPGANLGATGRNLGVALVSTPYVAFCDDDTWWEPGSLAYACDLLDEHPGVATLTGRIIVEPAGTEDPICADLRSSPLPAPGGLGGTSLVSFLAGASVIRRHAFVEAGGFSAHLFIGGEEELLAADLLAGGWHLVYEPDLAVHHHASNVRDAHLRRRQGIRNTLWFLWLRRPAGSALRRSAAVVASLPRDRVSAAAVLDALRGSRWVLGERRTVPPSVEAKFAAVDRDQFRSGARRYVS